MRVPLIAEKAPWLFIVVEIFPCCIDSHLLFSILSTKHDDTRLQHPKVSLCNQKIVTFCRRPNDHSFTGLQTQVFRVQFQHRFQHTMTRRRSSFVVFVLSAAPSANILRAWRLNSVSSPFLNYKPSAPRLNHPLESSSPVAQTGRGERMCQPGSYGNPID